MSAKLFKGLNCRNGAPEAQSLPETADNMKALGKMLGLNKPCIRASDTMTRNSATSGGMSGKMSLMGGLGGSASFSGNFQTSSSALDHTFREKGCGSYLLDSKDILDSMRRMNCTLHQSSSEAHQELSNRVSVQIRIVPIPGLKAKMSEQVVELTKELADVAAYKEVAQMIRDTIKGIQDTIKDMGNIDITDSTIRAVAKSKLKTMTQNVTSMASQLEADYKKVVEASANNTLQQHAGPNAMQPGVRQLVQQRIQSRTDEINTDIVQTLSHTSVKVTSSGSIIITAPNNIRLKNTVIDANSEIDMLTSALTSSSVDLGKRIASEMMATAASKNDMSTDNAGLTDLVTAMNEGNAAAIKAQGDSLIGQIKANAMPLSVGLIALVIIPMLIPMLTGGKNNGLAGPRMPPGMTMEQQKKWKAKQGRKKMIKIVIGLVVKLFVIFNLVRIGPKLLDVFLPWKWNQVMDTVKEVILNLIVLILYCVFVNKSPNPVMCLLKF